MLEPPVNAVYQSTLAEAAKFTVPGLQMVSFVTVGKEEVTVALSVCEVQPDAEAVTV